MGMGGALAVINVNDQNGLFSDLVFNAETFDIDDSDTREVCLPTDFWHRGQYANLPVNHFHQLAAEPVASVSLVKERKDGIQAVGELWGIDDF